MIDLFPTQLTNNVSALTNRLTANHGQVTVGGLISLRIATTAAVKAARDGDRLAARALLVQAASMVPGAVGLEDFLKATQPVPSNESLAAMRLAVIRPDTFEGDTMPPAMESPEAGYASEAFCQFMRHRGRSASVVEFLQGAFSEAAMRAEAASTGSWLSFWLATDGQLRAAHGFDDVESHKRAGHRLLGQFAAYFLPGSDGPVFKSACWAGNDPVFQPVGMLWRRLCQAYSYGTGLAVTTSPVV